DDFPDKENIYLIKSKQFYEGAPVIFSSTQGPLGSAVEKEIPGIERAVRLNGETNALFSIGEKRLYQKGRYVDSGFLKMFSIEFLRGDANSALSELNNIVL